jgi:hypothetical protein
MVFGKFPRDKYEWKSLKFNSPSLFTFILWVSQESHHIIHWIITIIFLGVEFEVKHAQNKTNELQCNESLFL